MAPAKPDYLKQEDQFISFWQKVYNYYLKYQNHFYVGLLAVVLVGAGVWGWVAYQKYQEKKAWSAYEAILDKEQPRTEAEAEQSIKPLTELIESRPGSKAAAQARLELAAISARQGNHEAAVKYYLAFLDTLERTDPLRPAVADALGHSFEALGKYDEAAQWYTTVSQNEKLAPLGLWGLGRVQELAGKKQEAVATYKKLIKDFPDSIYVSPVHDRLLALEG